MSNGSDDLGHLRFELDTVAPGLMPMPFAPDQGPQGGSGVERMLKAVDSHVQAEADSLATYERLRQTGDPLTALVLGLILEDEERHHALLRRISTSLQDALLWQSSPDALPTGDKPLPAPEHQTAVFKSLAEEEQHSVQQLQRVGRDLADVNDGLDTALLEMMALDSQKHARMLTFLQHRAERQARAR